MEVTIIRVLGITESALLIVHRMTPTSLDRSPTLNSDGNIYFWNSSHCRELWGNGGFCVYSAQKPKDKSGIVIPASMPTLNLCPLRSNRDPLYNLCELVTARVISS